MRGLCADPEELSFTSTDRFRVNANGRRLDVWLLFQCDRCGTGHKRPIHRRVAPTALPDLQAYQRNDVALARRLADGATEGDLDGAPRVFAVRGPPAESLRDGARIDVQVPPGLRVRLDRVVAAGLCLSRSAVRRHIDEGVLRIDRGHTRAWRRPVRDGCRLLLLPQLRGGMPRAANPAENDVCSTTSDPRAVRALDTG